MPSALGDPKAGGFYGSSRFLLLLNRSCGRTIIAYTTLPCTSCRTFTPQGGSKWYLSRPRQPSNLNGRLSPGATVTQAFLKVSFYLLPTLEHLALGTQKDRRRHPASLKVILFKRVADGTRRKAHRNKRDCPEFWVRESTVSSEGFSSRQTGRLFVTSFFPWD